MFRGEIVPRIPQQEIKARLSVRVWLFRVLRSKRRSDRGERLSSTEWCNFVVLAPGVLGHDIRRRKRRRREGGSKLKVMTTKCCLFTPVGSGYSVWLIFGQVNQLRRGSLWLPLVRSTIVLLYIILQTQRPHTTLNTLSTPPDPTLNTKHYTRLRLNTTPDSTPPTLHQTQNSNTLNSLPDQTLNTPPDSTLHQTQHFTRPNTFNTLPDLTLSTFHQTQHS